MQKVPVNIDTEIKGKGLYPSQLMLRFHLSARSAVFISCLSAR